jgi:hypothetical protein
VLIVTRASWGARFAAGFGAVALPVPEVWLHHTVMGRPAPDQAAEAAEVRRVEAVGQSRFGGGISYTFAVAPSGRVYEGTGAGRRGAHTKGRNSTAHAIVLLGDYSTSPMTAAQEQAVADLLRHGKAKGWWLQARLNGGHRDAPGATTSCPGGAAHRRIAHVNALVQSAPAAALKPAPIPAPVPITLKDTPAMILVLHHTDNRQFVCDKETARHVEPDERAVLVAGGVTYVGEADATDAQRRAFLAARGVA